MLRLQIGDKVLTYCALPMFARDKQPWMVAVIGASLILLVVIVFGGTSNHHFIAFDDPYYVSDNPIVMKGLTTDGVKWALTTTDYFYWHPLTWLSHMLD